MQVLGAKREGKSRLQAVAMSALREVAGVTRSDHIRNEIRHRQKQRSIKGVVRDKRES